MTKKLLLIGLGIALVAAAFVTSAAITHADYAAVSSSVVASPINVARPIFGPGPVCLPIVRSLTIGVTGSDVTALQTYLNAQGYLTVNPTGYFGPLTQSAVARWQAKGGVAVLGGSGSGIFGPLSRAYFLRACVGNPGGGSSSTTQNNLNFSGTPSSGIAPLTVQFTVSAPQGTTVGNSVNFGDDTTGTLGFAPVCSSCNLLATVSHTYTAPGTYTAALINGACACPANGVCNCPNLAIVATTVITVRVPGTTSTSTSGIQQLNSPGSVALSPGGIAEIRNANFYFTLSSVTASTATINVTPVGCWNSFPSDPLPVVRCMIATILIPPQTLSVGQEYEFGTHGITLTSMASGTATFGVQ